MAQPVMTGDRRTAFRTCPLCEAVCGLELTIKADQIVRVRGDGAHVFSKGFLCPKGASFDKLVHDPDRLTRPLVRQGRDWREVSWDEAFNEVDGGLRSIVETHGHEALANYTGNPSVHNMSGRLYLPALLKALRSRHLYSASTVDQMPKHVASGSMWGDHMAIAVPDIDRTDLLVILGANPVESNGSMVTAPDFPGRLAALRARGGRLVVIDPRRTKTAALADEHLRIRPGADVFLLFAIVHVLFADKLVALRDLTVDVAGIEEVAQLASAFAPANVADRCGVDGERIRQLAHAVAAAPSAVVYGRIGTTTVEFGTVTSWLIDVVNILTGNFDRPGGAMFPLPAHARVRRPGPGRGFLTGRWTSRVRGLPEVASELPAATLADEIETPGPGQIRGLITIAGNPVLSTPNSERLDTALASLEYMVSVDPYLNETTRHADVILPPTDASRVGHYDFALLANAVRNIAVYSPPAIPPDPGAQDECAILARLTLILRGDATNDPAGYHEALLTAMIDQVVADDASPVFGRDPAEVRRLVTGEHPADRLLDVMLRTGPYGDGFGTNPDGLTLARLIEHPHGIDLGPLRPRLRDVLRTPSQKLELCPPVIAADVDRARHALTRRNTDTDLVLVGRRHLRSNNSWMHNVASLVRGKPRCTLLMHPDDAARLGLSDRDQAYVESRAGTIVVPVQVSDEVLPGVVSLPHGWGHGVPGTRMGVANRHAGVNSNILTDEYQVDVPSGTAVLNAIPVAVTALPMDEPVAPHHVRRG